MLWIFAFSQNDKNTIISRETIGLLTKSIWNYFMINYLQNLIYKLQNLIYKLQKVTINYLQNLIYKVN